MTSSAPFRNFDDSHLFVLALTAGLPLALAWMARRTKSAGFVRGAALFLALLLATNLFFQVIYHHTTPARLDGQALPMQLCDWALFATIAALLTRNIYCFELAYFWGLAGTIQGIVTPELKDGFPTWQFFSFFVTHSGIVIAVLFMILAMRLRPQLSSLWRGMIWSEIYLVSALIVNAITGSNYGFLARKPVGPSLLDYLSSRPLIFIVELNLLAVVFFAALYLPFAVIDWRKRWRPRRDGPAEPPGRPLGLRRRAQLRSPWDPGSK